MITINAAHSVPLNVPALIGVSGAVQRIWLDIRDAARTRTGVVVYGETGCGKEVVARLVHALSTRQSQPFIAVPCDGVPDSLFYSELFGHSRGSFKGAFRHKTGVATTADGGTVLLDLVDGMSASMQAAVADFAESGEVQPLGASTYSHVDVRLLATTGRDLRALVARRQFSQDLFTELGSKEIYVPPLRERRQYILPLIHHYLMVCSERHNLPVPELATDAEASLCEYRWPGNARQLKNVAERIAVRQRGQRITARDLPVEMMSGSGATKAVNTYSLPNS